MDTLDQLAPMPRLVETDGVDLAVAPARAWDLVRHGNLARSPLVRALFALRTLPERLAGHDVQAAFGIGDLVSTPERPGFQILVDQPPHVVAVGAIGRVWEFEIPFVHVADGDAFAAFDEPGYVKVAWSLTVQPCGERASRVEVEVRVEPTDEAAWRKFRRYWSVIGPGSHFIRRALFSSLAREQGTLATEERGRSLPGDDLLADAADQITHGVTIEATPEEVWPWLVQMGCRRAGFYSYDLLDNGGERSARELHPELSSIAVGDILPATPESDDGFEVLVVDGPRALVLGGLYDTAEKTQLRFVAERPERFWQVTWAFSLEPLDAKRTRLHVRARVALPPRGRLRAAWIRPVHHFMQSAQLRHLAERVEGRGPRDDWLDVARGVGGAGVILAALATPFLRGARSHWGVDRATAEARHPGDELIAEPRWSWTHGIAIDAPPEVVWPWIAQVGADRAGFYSYQWLENIAGCELRNAEAIHHEWEHAPGSKLLLHPDMAMSIVDVKRGEHLVAHAAADGERGEGRVEATWLFALKPLARNRTLLVSRYRCATSDDLVNRLSFGPALFEPVGFAMDRRMLRGVKERVEGMTPRKSA